jgi:hypothetical protein
MSIWGGGALRHLVLLPLCLLATIAGRAQSSASLPCQSIYFKASLNAHEDFERELGGGLLFRVKSMKQPGWFIDVVPAEEVRDDYVYPVNPPLRFNPNQTLGPGNSETAESSLRHAHVMNFLLNRSDYEKISGLIDNVLWPYKTPDPDKAVSDYTNAVDEAKKGQLKVVVASHKIDRKSGAVEHIKLRVQITLPTGFEFAPGLYPLPSRCLN